MKLYTLELPGLILFEQEIYSDKRGYFQEVYHFEKYQKYLPAGTVFVQDNLSYSRYGTIRGLHFQKEPYAQAKLVRCTMGKILDVAVDIRRNSLTFGKHISVDLSDENHLQLFIPKGFAHGFSVLSDYAIVEYKCDELYHSEFDAGIRYDDTTIGIDWKINLNKCILSAKDKKLPLLNEFFESMEEI